MTATAATLDLRCRICGAATTLSQEPTARMAEVVAFCAAHNAHDDGLGVEVEIAIPRQVTVG